MPHDERRGRTETATELRQQAERARRLSYGVVSLTDQNTLRGIAEELEAKARELERDGHRG